MDSILNILLVEDNPDIHEKFQAEIDNADDVTLTKIATAPSDALQFVKNSAPNTIILDLDLQSEQGSGLEFLQHLKKLSLTPCPFLLIITSSLSVYIHDFAREAGADFIFSSCLKDYSEQKVIEFLRMMKPTILRNQNCNAVSLHEPETPLQKTQHLKKLIITELNQIGINPKHIGYKYLIDAILLIMEGAQPNIADIVSKKYNKTASSVERGIQHAIQCAWCSEDIHTLSTHYTAKIKSSRGVPTLNEFVYYYANKIKHMR